MSLMKWALLSIFATLLVACGGTDNAGTPIFGGGASGASGVAATASNLTIQLSTSSIDNSGANTVTATATATTAAGQALAGIPVTFSVDNNATFTQSSATTGVPRHVDCPGLDRRRPFESNHHYHSDERHADRIGAFRGHWRELEEHRVAGRHDRPEPREIRSSSP